MMIISMRWKIVLVLILGILAKSGLPIPTRSLEKSTRISLATTVEKGEKTSCSERFSTERVGSTSCMNWADFVSALPTLMYFPVSSTERPSANHTMMEGTYSNDLGTTKPTSSSSSETEPDQYDYLVSYDELKQVIKKLQGPGGSKNSRNFPANNVLQAIFNTGSKKQDGSIIGRTAARAHPLPVHYHVGSERRPQAEKGSYTKKQRINFSDAPLIVNTAPQKQDYEIYKVNMIFEQTTAITSQLPGHYNLGTERRPKAETSSLSTKYSPKFSNAPPETFKPKISTAGMQLWYSPGIPTINLPQLK